MIVLQLPAFPNRPYFGWEGTPGTAQDPAGLADGWQVYFLGVLFLILYSLGVLEGTGSEAEACHSSKIVQLFYIMLFSLLTNPIEIK